MKFFFLFAPAFVDWPLAMIREIKQRHPESLFGGVYRGGKFVHAPLSEHNDPPLDSLYSMAALEDEWVSTDYDVERMNQWEALYGPGFLQRILISDRKVGHGYLSGGVIPPCTLSKRSTDPEFVRRYIYGVVRFAERILLEEKFDRVFCYAVAGSLAVALMEMCRYHKIPFFQLVHTRIEQKYILDDASESILAPIARLFRESLQNPDLVKDMIPKAEQFLDRFRNQPTEPGYMAFCKNEMLRGCSWLGTLKQLYRDFYGVLSVTLKQTKKELDDIREWDLLVYNLKKSFRQRRLLHESFFQTIDQIPKRPYAYYPLHVDPEASTMVLAPMHVNQLQVIEAIAKSIPLSWNLLVKEHLPNLGKRPIDFYDRLRRIPGVVLVSPSENNFSLIRNAEVICTITGTAGWEALMLKKPVVVFGHTPYLELEKGLVYNPDLSRLPRTIQEALATPPIDDRLLIHYIAAIYTLGFDFPTDLFWGKVTRQTIAEHPDILHNLCDRVLSPAWVESR